MEGKVCVVTGGGSGIGAAMAQALAAEGATVVVADVTDGAAVHADVSIEEDVRALMDGAYTAM